MDAFNILTPGEKIKNIRDQFNFKQEDITCGDITRNLVSIIENNKANLTESVAKTLATGINNLCKERNINFSVTEEYLLEDVVSQAKKVADEYILYINNLPKNEIINISDKLTEIDVFLKTYNAEEKKSLLYRAIAKKFIEIKLYSKATDYYLKAYESSINNKSTINILISLGACCSYLSKYDEALNYYKLLLDLSKDVQPTYVAKFNIALCNKKLKKYDEALNYLYELKENFKEIPPTVITQYEVDNLIGICLLNLNSYNKAISIFKDLLKNSLSENDEVITLTNLADVYDATKDYKSLKKVCDKIKDRIEISPDFMNSYEGDIYISLAKNLIHIGDIEYSKALLLKALESFKLGDSKICLESIEDTFANLLNLYINESDTDKIDFLKNEFFELIQKEMLPKGSITALRFIKYYNSTKESTKIDTILNFLVS